MDETKTFGPQIVDNSIGFGKTAQTYGRLGHLEVRLASNDEEVQAAQALRYRVFVNEMGAELPLHAMAQKLDIDQYDKTCEHLLVIDHNISGLIGDRIVGTYRLLTQDNAQRTEGFYSQSEYDVAAMISRHQNRKFLELGRSCVLPNYRNKRTIELLWQGIWAYSLEREIDVMFGCASFSGTVPAAHAKAMSFIYHHARSDDHWQVNAHESNRHSMDFMPEEAVSAKEALLAMPPLVKAYLRLGARISPEAVIDFAFNTTDILVVLPVEFINRRYIDYYRPDATRFAA